MKITHVLTYAILVAVLVSCTKDERLKVSSSFVEFTTDVKITLYNLNRSDTIKAEKSFKSSRKIFEYFNSEMNPYVATSSLNKLNSIEPNKKTEIPVALREIIKISLNIYKYTDKYFNVAIQPVVQLWGFYSNATPAKPDMSELENVLKISDMDLYGFSGDSLIVKDKRCRIGLGGIAKGYAIDSVASYLSSEGYNDFIVEAGGDLVVRSSEPKRIGIKHPRIENALIDTLYVKNGAVATSGDYEKYIIEDGVRYCHIINPYTGYGTSDVLSVTVISEKAYLSDAFATALFAMGLEKAEYILKKNDLSGIIYYFDGEENIKSRMINIDKYLKK